MTRALILPLPGEERRAAALARALGADEAVREIRRFPDGETYVRLDTPAAARDVVLVCGLERADERLVPLLLAAATARDLGAARVVLVAPYLGYMRQDDRFRDGEGVTSRYVGALLSGAVDALVTVDPHLHRHAALEDVYDVACARLSAAPLLGAWVRENVARPLLVGPDAESAQWVAAAAGGELPSVVFEKVRHGDREVDVRAPDLAEHVRAGRTPVIVDDVVSTGRTVAAAARILREAGLAPPVCAAVHALFVGDALDALAAAGVGRVVTTATVPHATNAIDVTPLLAEGVRRALAGG